MTAPLDLVVLTGFLGSGKTTLLADYLAQRGSDDIAIIVNEAASVSLDDSILLDKAKESEILLLANGCLCCRSGGELSASIEALLRARDKRSLSPLRQIVIETSGLAMPGPILREIADLAHVNLTLRFVGLWDCTRNALQIGRPESRAQVAATETIVLTKEDAADDAEICAARAALARLNPLARLVRRIEGLQAMSAGLPGHSSFATLPSEDEAHGETTIWVKHLPLPVQWAGLTEWIDNLAGLAGERLLHVKGLVQVDDGGGRILIQGVGTSFSQPSRIRSDASPVIVVIAERMSAEEIESVRPALQPAPV
jgi:G3E family GTPase